MGKALYAENNSIPQEMLLGNLVFMNLTDMQISEDDFKDVFRRNNIPEDYVRSISEADAFRRATSSVKNKIINYKDLSGETVKGRIEVDEVLCLPSRIKRVLGLKTVKSGRSSDIDYRPYAEIELDRGCSTAVYQSWTVAQNACQLPYSATSQLDKALEDMEANYNEWSVYHNKDTVRNTINRIVQATHPISLLGTGLCKFIPIQHKDTLYNLKNALGDLNAYCITPGGANCMEIIPVIDTEEQRDLTKNSLETEMTKDLFDFMKELNTVIVSKKADGISTKSINSYISRYKAFQEKVDDYEKIVGIYMTAIREKIKSSIDLVKELKEAC